MPISESNQSPPMDIGTLFDQVTSKYDFMNDIMSFGLHRHWKKMLVNLIPQFPNLCLLDIASGTGDIAFSYLKKSQEFNPQITLFDLSSHMIQYSKDRVINENIKGELLWQIGKAEALPFEDESFDVCTVSFGLRNFENKEQSLREIYRVLKPRGIFLCLEFSQPDYGISSIYDVYLSSFIPKIGKVLAQNEKAYSYLAESIRYFPDVEKVKHMIERSGFNAVSYLRLTKGITAIHRGWK